MPVAYPAWDDILDLVAQGLDDDFAPGAAGPHQLADLEHTLGRALPPTLRDWLTRCNGTLAGEGGIYGADPGDDFLSIQARLKNEWPAGWIPVAGDGCGNEYVLDAARSHIDTDAIYFCDREDDWDEHVGRERPSYIVASDLRLFLTFMLKSNLHDMAILDEAPGDEHPWPFDRDFMLARDPDLARISDPSLLPWHPDDG